LGKKVGVGVGVGVEECRGGGVVVVDGRGGVDMMQTK